MKKPVPTRRPARGRNALRTAADFSDDAFGRRATGTLALARRAWPAAPSHALEDLVPALGLLPRLQALLPGREPHDALYDAVACALLLLHLLDQPGWGSLSPAELAAVR